MRSAAARPRRRRGNAQIRRSRTHCIAESVRPSGPDRRARTRRLVRGGLQGGKRPARPGPGHLGAYRRRQPHGERQGRKAAPRARRGPRGRLLRVRRPVRGGLRPRRRGLAVRRRQHGGAALRQEKQGCGRGDHPAHVPRRPAKVPGIGDQEESGRPEALSGGARREAPLRGGRRRDAHELPPRGGRDVRRRGPHDVLE